MRMNSDTPPPPTPSQKERERYIDNFRGFQAIPKEEGWRAGKGGREWEGEGKDEEEEKKEKEEEEEKKKQTNLTSLFWALSLLYKMKTQNYHKKGIID